MKSGAEGMMQQLLLAVDSVSVHIYDVPQLEEGAVLSNSL